MANSFKEVSKQADSNVYSVSDMKYIDINDWNALGANKFNPMFVKVVE